MQKIYNLIGLDIKILLAVLREYCILSIKEENNNVIKLFEIYNPDSKKIVEEFLQKYTNSLNKSLITNKTKPLFVTIKHVIDSKWCLNVFQNNARGIKLTLDFNLLELPSDVFSIIKPIENVIANLATRNLIDKSARDLNKNILYLGDKKLIDVLLDRKGLTLLERKQVVFTYNYYNHLYDKNYEKIDDLKQQKDALDLNNLVKFPLESLIELRFIHDIDLKKGE